jgi:hypothetical protein
MKRLIDMDNKSDVGTIDWEFIHDMQGIVPHLINYNGMILKRDFLEKIPEKHVKIKKALARHLTKKSTIHLAFSDIENRGTEFKVTGTLVEKGGRPLAFYKVEIFDEDRFEDDFIGSVITDEKGTFSMLFGKQVFSDFGLEALPDIYFKIFEWKKDQFVEKARLMPKPHEISETSQNKHLLEFGIIEV